jgi:hypothetical protein
LISSSFSLLLIKGAQGTIHKNFANPNSPRSNLIPLARKHDPRCDIKIQTRKEKILYKNFRYGLPQIDSSSHKQDSDTWPPQFPVEKFQILPHRDAGDKQTKKGLDIANTKHPARCAPRDYMFENKSHDLLRLSLKGTSSYQTKLHASKIASGASNSQNSRRARAPARRREVPNTRQLPSTERTTTRQGIALIVSC